MVLSFENICNWMHKDLFKRPKINEKKGDLKIEGLIITFSKKVANGNMKYYPAVKSLEKYILDNHHRFKGDSYQWKKILSPTPKPKKKIRSTSSPQTHTSVKRLFIKQYILEAIDYYNKNRLKFEKEQEIKYENRKKKFDETRVFTTH